MTFNSNTIHSVNCNFKRICFKLVEKAELRYAKQFSKSSTCILSKYWPLAPEITVNRAMTKTFASLSKETARYWSHASGITED